MEAVLFIGGSDSSAGAGIQADLKVAWEYNVYGVSALTSITAQTAQRFVSLEFVSPNLLQKQLQLLWDTFDIPIVKTGLIGNPSLLKVIVQFFKDKSVKIICDPVLKTSTGYSLEEKHYVEMLKNEFFPMVYLLTPNKHEALKLLDQELGEAPPPDFVLSLLKEMIETPNILLKGGHWLGNTSDDYLIVQEAGNKIFTLKGERIVGIDLHGSGCRLASAIACGYVKQKGITLIQNVEKAKRYVFNKMQNTENKFYFT